MAEPVVAGTDLLARRHAAVARGVSVALPLVVEEASGAVLRDQHGRRVIDFAGGIGCLNVGHTVRARFLAWQARYAWIGDVRGVGAMQAMELVTASGAPDGARAAAVQREAAARDLLVMTAGTFGNVLRTLMPLVIPTDVLEQGLDVLAAALAAADGLAAPGTAA